MRFNLLARARLGAADHYLSRTDIPVSDLADMLGYGDVSAFSRAFKKSRGLAPGHWRKQQEETG